MLNKSLVEGPFSKFGIDGMTHDSGTGLNYFGETGELTLDGQHIYLNADDAYLNVRPIPHPAPPI